MALYQEFVNFIRPRLLEGNHKQDIEEQYAFFTDFCCLHCKSLDAV